MVYPISLHITGRHCLIIGGGEVAVRKAQGLLAEGASVTVLSPSLHSDFTELQVTHIRDSYHSRHLIELAPFLVFAATDSVDINQQIVRNARSAGILVNTVDNSADDDFSNLLILHRPPLTIAISTGGASPVLGQYLRDEIEALIGDHYPTLAQWLADLREMIQSRVKSITRRREFWQRVMASDILTLLKQGQIEPARTRLTTLVDEAVGESA